MASNKRWKCYFGCEVDGILHRFPNPSHDPDRFHLWKKVLNIEMQESDLSYIYNNLRFCDNHFEMSFRTPSRKLTRNAFPTLKIGIRQAVNLPILMDESILAESATINLPTVPVSQEITQPLLQSDLLINFITEAVPSTSLCINATPEIPYGIVPSTCKDTLQSADKFKINETILQTRLQKKSYMLQRKLKSLSLKCKTQKKKIECAKNVSNSKQFLKYLEKLPDTMQTFWKLQTKGKKNARGRRYTTDEKVMALSIFKESPKAYNFLKKMFVLPSKRSLQSLLSLLPLKPGINDVIFQHLQNVVKRLPRDKRLCTLMFDEVALEPGLYFNKGHITGFEDYGHKRSSQIADHALVLMLKSIKGKFKQPISFTFCKSCTKKDDLKYLIKEVIKQVYNTGLQIISTICDQSQTNISVIKSLREDTRAEYLRKDVEHHSCSFEINNQKIFPLFDTPHLLKGVRNNLLKKQAIFFINGTQKCAKWEHIVLLFNIDVGEHEIRLVNKLTEFHIFENKIPKMKVKHAAQVFSQRVSSAIGFLARHNVLPVECEDTASFLLMFDKLFDSFNGNTYSGTTKELKGCLKNSSPHQKYWTEVLPVLKTIQFKSIVKNKDGTETTKLEKVPSILNWVSNIETFLEMWEFLKREYHISNLLTRNFNQDPLENFFCGIRSNGIRNTNPTCAQFVNAYKTLLVNNLNSSHSVNANCEPDDSKCLQALTHLVNIPKNKVTQENTTFNIDYLVQNLSASTASDDQNIVHAESKRYVAGYIINQCQKYVFKSCPECKKIFFNSNRDTATYTYYRDYTKRSLIYVNDDFIEICNQIYEIITLSLKNSPESMHLKDKIELMINIDIDFRLITCESHKTRVIKQIIGTAINIVVHSWCKGVNQLLKGKITNFDHNDSVKGQARSYYLKRCRKK